MQVRFLNLCYFVIAQLASPPSLNRLALRFCESGGADFGST
jgi:hypothetical protein